MTGEYCTLTELLPKLRAQVATEQQRLDNIRASIETLSNQSGSYFSGTEPDFDDEEDDEDVSETEFTSAGSSFQNATQWEEAEPETYVFSAAEDEATFDGETGVIEPGNSSWTQRKFSRTKPTPSNTCTTRRGPFADPLFPKFNALAKRLDHAARQCFLDANKDIQDRVKEIVESRHSCATVKNPSSFLTSLITAERVDRSTAAAASDSRPSDLTAFEHLDIDRRARRKLRSLSARKRRQIKQQITESPGLRNPSAMVMFLCSQLE